MNAIFQVEQGICTLTARLTFKPECEEYADTCGDYLTDNDAEALAIGRLWLEHEQEIIAYIQAERPGAAGQAVSGELA